MLNTKLWVAAIIIALFAHEAFAQPCSLEWGPIVPVSNTSRGTYVPKVAVVGDTVHVVYLAGGLYYRRSTNGGTTWGTQFELVQPDSMSGQVFSRPIAAAGGNVYVVYGNRLPSGSIRAIKVRRSTDAGQAWFQPQEIITNRSLPEYGTQAIAAHGKFVYVVVGKPIAGYAQAFIARSDDYGGSWDSVRQITFGNIGTSPWDIVACPQAVHVTCTQTVVPLRSDVGHMFSSDNGNTWSPIKILSTLDDYRAWEPVVAADNGGNVYVCWQDTKYGSTGYGGATLLRRSSDGGVSWGSEIRVNTTLPSAVRSSLCASDTHVFVLWDDERFGTFYIRPYFSTSTNHGQTWCNEYHLSDSVGASGDASIGCSRNVVCAFWSTDIPPYIRTRSARYFVTDVRHPRSDRLAQPTMLDCFPNPSNSNVEIKYRSSSGGYVRLVLYDLLGKEKGTLINDRVGVGEHTVWLNTNGYPSGMYLLVMNSQSGREVKKIVLLR